jgi:hypothetical protein
MLSDELIKSNRTPPYASYATWQKLIEALKTFLPDQIDSSYYRPLRLSGSAIKALKGALRYLGLVNEENKPTDKLCRLIRAARENDEEKRNVLRETLGEAYKPLFSDDFNLQRATPGKLADYLEKAGAKRGQMVQKCATFFLSLASEAQVPLSPALAGKSRLGVGRKSVVLKGRERQRRKKQRDSQGKISKRPSTESLLDIAISIADLPEEKQDRVIKAYIKLTEALQKPEERPD